MIIGKIGGSSPEEKKKGLDLASTSLILFEEVNYIGGIFELFVSLTINTGMIYTMYDISGGFGI